MQSLPFFWPEFRKPDEPRRLRTDGEPDRRGDFIKAELEHERRFPGADIDAIHYERGAVRAP